MNKDVIKKIKDGYPLTKDEELELLEEKDSATLLKQCRLYFKYTCFNEPAENKMLELPEPLRGQLLKLYFPNNELSEAGEIKLVRMIKSEREIKDYLGKYPRQFYDATELELLAQDNWLDLLWGYMSQWWLGDEAEPKFYAMAGKKKPLITKYERMKRVNMAAAIERGELRIFKGEDALYKKYKSIMAKKGR